MDTLRKYLNKIGVKSYEDLTSDEKETYKLWEEALSGRKLTDEDVVSFLELELQTAITRLTEVNLSKEDEIFRKMEVRMIRKIQDFLSGPIKERQLLEAQLNK